MATLFVVATPVGNLQDMTLRAIETLKTVDAILCEDTRVTAKLLDHFAIKKPLIAYHQHSTAAVVERIAKLLRDGSALALVSDAGTPGINDPGGKLVADLRTRFDLLFPRSDLGIGARSDLKIVPIPGANAAITALSVSGFPADRYQYWGFVPHKKGRQTFFRDLAACEDTVVFYESKHRIAKTLMAMGTIDRPMMVARELTKLFETLYRGTAEQILEALKADKTLGEFVVVVAPKNWK